MAIPDFETLMRPVLVAVGGDESKTRSQIRDVAVAALNISDEDRQVVLPSGKQARFANTTLERLHRAYLRSVAREALADGVVVTDDERDELLSVATAPGFAAHDVEAALKWAAAHAAEAKASGFALRPGDRVVFTGR